MGTQAAAEQMGVAERTVRWRAKHGVVPGAVLHAGAWHIPVEEVDRQRQLIRQAPPGPEHDIERAKVALLQLVAGGRIPRRLQGEIRVLHELSGACLDDGDRAQLALTLLAREPDAA